MSKPQASDSSRVRRSLLQRSAVLTAALAFGAVVVPASPLSSTGEMADRTVSVLKTVHLLGFASWFGTVVWTTFIAVSRHFQLFWEYLGIGWNSFHNRRQHHASNFRDIHP